jgi:hypothetical protein
MELTVDNSGDRIFCKNFFGYYFCMILKNAVHGSPFQNDTVFFREQDISIMFLSCLKKHSLIYSFAPAFLWRTGEEVFPELCRYYRVEVTGVLKKQNLE